MKNFYISTYTTIDTIRFANTFINSLKNTISATGIYFCNINLSIIYFSDDDDIEEIKEIAKELKALNSRHLNINISILQTSIASISKIFKISETEMRKGRLDQKNEDLTTLSYKFKMACSALIRYQSLYKEYSKIYDSNKSVPRNQSYCSFLHADIDTFFKGSVFEIISKTYMYDVGIYLREEIEVERGKIFGGILITPFKIKPEETIFSFHKQELCRIKPEKWEKGYGQLSLYRAYKNLISSHNIKILELSRWFQESDPLILRGNRGGRHLNKSYNKSSRWTKGQVLNFFHKELIKQKHMKLEIYSRITPSPIYQVLHEEYLDLHKQDQLYEVPKGQPQPFSGKKVCQVAPALEFLNKITNNNSLLDYGGGKGTHYTDRIKFKNILNDMEFNGLHGLLGINRENISIYDPASCTSDSQITSADLVISSDALEHLHEDDVIWAINEIFSHANKAVFISIPTYLDKKILSCGLPAHMTVRSNEWWFGLIKAIAARFPNITYICIARSKKAINLSSNIIKKRDILGNIIYSEDTSDLPKFNSYDIQIDGKVIKRTYDFNSKIN